MEKNPVLHLKGINQNMLFTLANDQIVSAKEVPEAHCVVTEKNVSEMMPRIKAFLLNKSTNDFNSSIHSQDLTGKRQRILATIENGVIVKTQLVPDEGYIVTQDNADTILSRLAPAYSKHISTGKNFTQKADDKKQGYFASITKQFKRVFLKA